jgi:hypothetical protein
MTAQQEAFEVKFENKLNTQIPYLMKTAKGDKGLIQEGVIGIWQNMNAFPDAATKFHATKAKWSIINVASPSTTERHLKRIGLERVREVMEDLSRDKRGEVVEFKHWPQKIALPGLQE